MPTVSMNETIQVLFDRFFKEIKYKDISMSEELYRLLNGLESDVLEEAGSDYSTEMLEKYEEGFTAGYEQCELDNEL